MEQRHDSQNSVPAFGLDLFELMTLGNDIVMRQHNL